MDIILMEKDIVVKDDSTKKRQAATNIKKIENLQRRAIENFSRINTYRNF